MRVQTSVIRIRDNSVTVVSRWPELTLFCIFFFGNCILSLFMKYPIITDEYITLAEGVFLTGNTSISETFRTLSNTGYFGWGYAIIYGVVYNLFRNMGAVYHMALIINSCLVALIPVFAYRIATHNFSASKKHTFVISCCVGVYPAYTIYSKYSMNETALLFLVWPLLYMLLGFWQASVKKRVLLSLLLGLFSAYAYAIHGRGLAILCMSLLCFCVLLLTTKDKWFYKAVCFASFFMIVLFVNYLNSLVRNHIASGFIGQDVSNLRNTTEEFLNPAFFKSLIGPNSIRILYGFFGQSLYIIVATLGLAAVSVVVYLFIVWRCWNKKEFDSWVIIGTYSVGLMASTLLISVLFFSNLYITEAVHAGEYYIYGRYNELTGGLLIFFSLLFFYAYKEQKKSIITWSLPLYFILMLGGMFTAFRKILNMGNPKLSYTMAIGLVPFSGSDIYLKPTSASYLKLLFIALLIFLLIVYLIRSKRQRLLWSVCIVLFVYSSIFSLHEFIFPQSANRYNSVRTLAELNNKLSKYEGNCLDTVYVLDSVVPKPKNLFAFADFPVRYMENVQYSYAGYGEAKENSLFVSTKDEWLDFIFEEFYYIEFNDFQLWGYGEKLKTQLEEMGYICGKRQRPVYVYNGSQLQLLKDAESRSISNRTNSLYIQPGELQYGPYISRSAGYYQIDIYGKNLTAGSYLSYFNQGATHLQLTNLTVTDSHVRYFIAISYFVSDLEFICINGTDDYILIDSLVITPLQERSQTSVADAQNVYYRTRYYDVSDRYRDFRYYLSTNEDCVVGWEYYRLNYGGELIINNVPMPPGESRFTLEGTNIQLADVSVLGPDGNPVSFSIEPTETTTVFYADCPEAVSIVIRNNSEELIDFSGLGIRWVNSYS